MRVRTTLDRIEDYYDAVPRTTCRVEEYGPLVLFVNQRSGWPYYARPRRGSQRRITPDHVRRVRARQRALGLPEALEWVAEISPTLREAAITAGLHVTEHPVLVLDRDAWRPAPAPPDVTVGLADPDVSDVALLRSLAALAFGEPGTAVGLAGPAELRTAVSTVAQASVDDTRARLLAGLTVLVTASDGEGPLAVGSHQPVDSVTELTGVGTLPAARRRGLASAVTSELVRDALARGIETVFLSAESEDVARIYRRLGFRDIATALIAEPPAV